MPETLVWDTEALETKAEGMSWGEYQQRAGVSVACVIAHPTGLPTFYTHTDRSGNGYTLEDLGERLEAAELVVSFNGIRWDTPVLSETLERPLTVQELDLWAEITGATTRRHPNGTWKLGEVCQRTLGVTKTADGAFAPSLWRDGELGRLVTYCYRDVWLTWKLYEHILQQGFVLDECLKPVRVTL